VAYYAAISLFPLMMVLVAGVGYFFRFMPEGPGAKEQILASISQQISPELGEALERVLSQVHDKALVNGPLAMVAFFFAASLVFAQIDRGFYRIWDVRQRSSEKGLWAAFKQMVSSRVRSLLMIGSACVLVVAMFFAGLAMRAISEISWDGVPLVPMLAKYPSLLLGFGINILVFAMLYRFLSKEPVRWRLCLEGGVVAALFWEGGSRALTLLSFGSNLSVYGLIGSFLVVLLWIYYNVMVLFLGALVVREGAKGKKKR